MCLHLIKLNQIVRKQSYDSTQQNNKMLIINIQLNQIAFELL